MSVWGCYFIAMIPLIAAGFIWYKYNRIVWWEAVIIPILGLITALIFNCFAVSGMTTDTETWSGQVIEAVYVPEWLEYYEYAVYRTETYTESETEIDSQGRTRIVTVTKTREVFDHWEPTTKLHRQRWYCGDTLNNSHSISQHVYNDIVSKFGDSTTRQGRRRSMEHNSRMISGDPNDYISVNKNNFIYPTTDTRSWENKIKACPSVFSYKKVEPDEPVYEYPENNNRFSSGRLIGQTGSLSTFAWDQLNSFLGPIKKVNLIAVGFGSNADESYAETQEAKWIGGKKNDLVICFGGGTIAKPKWVKVFGWTESDLVKLEIQDIIIKNGINEQILPLIQNTVMKNYQIKDWSKFDYLTVEIPFHLWLWMLFTVIIVTGGFTLFAWYNGTNKVSEERSIYDRYYKR